MHRPPWPNRLSSAGHLENYKIAFCILSPNTSLTSETQFVFENCSNLATRKFLLWGER